MIFKYSAISAFQRIRYEAINCNIIDTNGDTISVNNIHKVEYIVVISGKCSDINLTVFTHSD